MAKSISDRIRRLIKKNPNASYDDLKKMFKVVDRSIIVTYYRIYKETLKKSGSLKRNIKKPAPVRKRVVEYFEQHPDHTISEAAEALKMDYIRVYTTVYNARISGFDVQFRRAQSRKTSGLAEMIREYIRNHPESKPKECAKVIGTSANYVSITKHRMKYSAKNIRTVTEEENARLRTQN